MSTTTLPGLSPVKDPAVSAVLGARRKRMDKLVRILSLVATGVGLVFLASILITLFVQGFGALNLSVFTNVTKPPGSDGGLLNAIIGSLIQVSLATVIGTPIGMLVGTYLAEYARGSTFGDIVRFVSDILLSAPLILIGLFNLTILIDVWRSFQQARRTGRLHEDDTNALLARRGFLARILRPLFAWISKPWHMYPLGFLFALGFDTATEISLFGIAAASASNGVSFLDIMCFPLLFTAGMALADTADGVMMLGAYGWAFVKPIRKLFYNLAITLVSVLVAFVIGGIEALGLIGERLGLQGWFWDLVAGANDQMALLGFIIVGVFAGAWALSALIYRLGGYDNLEIKAEA